jgi:hypothetical protein
MHVRECVCARTPSHGPTHRAELWGRCLSPKQIDESAAPRTLPTPQRCMVSLVWHTGCSSHAALVGHRSIEPEQRESVCTP